MSNLIFHHQQFQVSTKMGVSIINVSNNLCEIVRQSKVTNGTLNATTIGSTASITTIEYESGVIEDLRRAIDRLAPPDMEYEHEKAWHDGNGHSHVQAALLGPSISLPIRQGRLAMGTWQQVVVINHDNRARNRKVEVSIIGA